MTHQRTTPILGALALGAGLWGCAEIEVGAELAKRASTSAEPPSTQRVERFAPAPQVFSATGLTVWDGRPSLGGLWVAHPLTETARRVRIANLATGEEIDGALVRRDPTLAGPSIQLSADAAVALGVAPGRPTEVSIVALERVVEDTVVAQTETPPPVAEPPAEPPAKAPTPEPEPAEPEPVAEAPTPEPLPESEPEREPEQPAPAQVETPTDPAPQTQVAAVPQPKPEARPAAPPKSGRYVLVATFGVAENADRTVAQFQAEGFPATQKDLAQKSRVLKRVLVGPFDAEQDVQRALTRARALGFKDATRVKG